MDEIRTEFRRPYRRGRHRARPCRGSHFPRRPGRAEITAGVRAEISAGTAARTAGAVEQGQFAAEALQHHLGRVAVLPGLILPFACLQRAFDVNLRALFQILLGDLAQVLIEDHDPVPLGLFLALAGRLVAPRIRGRYAQIGDRPAVLGPANFRIGAEVADQNHFVHASCHHTLRSLSVSVLFVTVLPGLSPARPIEPLSALSTRVLPPAPRPPPCVPTLFRTKTQGLA